MDELPLSYQRDINKDIWIRLDKIDMKLDNHVTHLENHVALLETNISELNDKFDVRLASQFQDVNVKLNETEGRINKKIDNIKNVQTKQWYGLLVIAVIVCITSQAALTLIPKLLMGI